MNGGIQKRLLFDWHIPGFLDEVRLDVPAYLEAVDRMRPDAILLMAKSAFGCTYYDDAYGYHNQPLAQDILAELVPALRARGIEPIAYYNVALNDVVAREHPEWHQVDPDGTPVIKFDYHQLCMNSPYRELLMHMMADLAGKYDVAGFWFDITYVHEPGCFCAYCREGFRAETGLELTPDIGRDPRANARFHAFRRETRRRFITEAIARLRAVRPGLRFGYNHAGDPLYSEPEVDRSADWLSMEFHPPHYGRGGINARVMDAKGKPFELMLPESLGSWGDWSVMSPHTMRTMVGIAAAHGGSPTVGHVAYPSGDLGGRLAEGVDATIASAFRYLEERRPWCVGAESVPVGALLHSVESFRAEQAAGGLPRLPKGHGALFGAAGLLGDCAIPYDVLSEQTLDRLSEYEFLVLPETGYVSDSVAAALREYVQGGGSLVALGPVSLLDAFGQVQGLVLRDVLGAEYVQESPFSVAYVEPSDARLAEGLPAMPILAKAGPSNPHVPPVRRSLHCRVVEGSRALATLVEPEIESDFAAGYHIYHGHAPAANRTSWPAAIHSRRGAGQVIYFPVPMASVYGATRSPWLRRLVQNGLGILGSSRRVRIAAPPGVEVALRRQGPRWLLHLIPRRTETPESSQVGEGGLIRGVRVTVRKAGAAAARLVPEGTELRCQSGPEGLAFEVPPFGEWTTVEIA